MTNLIPRKHGDLLAGRYRIDALLGQGGFGVVYAARDIEDGRRVAIKLLDAASDDLAARARFEREVAIVGRLDSPHIVALLDHGSTRSGELFAVFEHIPGTDLSDVLEARDVLEPRIVTHILTQTLLALRAAHGEGLLHRDIKPENIRVFETADDPWRVKLLDFGIARSNDTGHPSITKTGELVGTPRYMSPEQLTQQPLTPASDIYSLGLVGYETLLGRSALHGGSWGAQLERLQEGYEMGDEGQDTLSLVLNRMTKRDPAARYQSADAALHVLTGAARRSVLSERRGGLAIGLVLLAVIMFAIAALSFKDPVPAPVRVNQVDGSALIAEQQLAPMPSEDAGHPDLPLRAPQAGACGSASPFHGSGRVAGFDAYLPNRPAGTKMPLVVLLHDQAQNPATLLRNSGFPALAEEHGFAVIAPRDDSPRPWQQVPTAFRPVVDAALSALCVDTSRLFFVGQGDGGRLVEKLSCEPWVTAVAKNSHRMLRGEPQCTPAPLIMFTPTRSERLPVDGGHNHFRTLKRSLADEESVWRRLYQCQSSQAEAVEAELPASCHSYDCPTAFTSCLLDGGEPWPGTKADIEADFRGAAPDYPLAKHIWEFFDKQEPLPTPCAAAPLFTGKRQFHGDLDSPWWTYVPTGAAANTPLPLVVLLHQNMESAKSFLDTTGFAELADRENFFVIAPSDNAIEPWKDEADVDRLREIVRQTTRGFCVDDRRIFVVGQAQGGYIAEKLSCEPWVLGLAMNSHRNRDAVHRCERPVPLIMLSPLHSPHEPVEGGVNCDGKPKASLREFEDSWLDRNHCKFDAQVSYRHRGSTCTTWTCETPFESCHLNGGHDWPNSPARPSEMLTPKCRSTPPDFPSAAYIWHFLANASGLSAPKPDGDAE